MSRQDNKIDIEDCKPLYERSITVGRPKTKGLFKETSESPDDQPIFTLEWEDKETGLPSARKIYMEAEDPTEFIPAMKIAGSVEGWKELCNSPKIFKYIQVWRSDLEGKIRSEAVRKLKLAMADPNSKNSLAACKYFADKGWLKTTDEDPLIEKREAAKVKRKEKREERKPDPRILEDAQRLGLRVIVNE